MKTQFRVEVEWPQLLKKIKLMLVSKSPWEQHLNKLWSTKVIKNTQVTAVCKHLLKSKLTIRILCIQRSFITKLKQLSLHCAFSSVYFPIHNFETPWVSRHHQGFWVFYRALWSSQCVSFSEMSLYVCCCGFSLPPVLWVLGTLWGTFIFPQKCSAPVLIMTAVIVQSLISTSAT